MQFVLCRTGDELAHSHFLGLKVSADLRVKSGVNMDADAFCVWFGHRFLLIVVIENRRPLLSAACSLHGYIFSVALL